MIHVPRKDYHEVGKPIGVFVACSPRPLERAAMNEKADPIASTVLMELMAEIPFAQ